MNFLPGFSAPIAMGVINMSPNSFMNPQKNADEALKRIEQMVSAGARIIDVGGEATSPSVDIVKELPAISEEMDRVLPIVEAIKNRFDVLISVDTSEPEVTKAAILAGAHMINIQQVKKNREALAFIAQHNVLVCLMHFFTPMRTAGSCTGPELFIQVKNELEEFLEMAVKAGISREKIILDPGFGSGKNYGKNTQENFYLLSRLEEFNTMGYPLLLGWSRKSMIGEALGGQPPEARLYGSLAIETFLALRGVAIIRTHDVQPVCDMLKIIPLLQSAH